VPKLSPAVTRVCQLFFVAGLFCTVGLFCMFLSMHMGILGHIRRAYSLPCSVASVFIVSRYKRDLQHKRDLLTIKTLALLQGK